MHIWDARIKGLWGCVVGCVKRFAIGYLNGIQEVRGSIPLSSTLFYKALWGIPRRALFIFGEFTTVLQLFCKVKEISISIPRRLLMIWVNKTRDNSMTSQGTCVVSESIFSELSENSNCLDPTGIIFLSKLLNASRQGEFTQIYPNPDLK